MPPTLAAAIAAPGRAPAGRGARRVRLSMYLAFALVAVGLLAQGWNSLRLEAARTMDGEIADKAAVQRAFSQQVGRSAALMALAGADESQRTRHGDALGVMSRESFTDALALQELLERRMAESPAVRQRLRPALDDWETARERLWYRTEVLLRHADHGGDWAAIERSAADVQVATGPAMQAASRLSQVLRELSAERAQDLRRQVQGGGIALLVLLGLLGLAVVEPTARSVRRHALRLAEQATELQRLALVAEHTSALVVVSDRDNRVQWVNAAFTRVLGWTLEDLRGRRTIDTVPSPNADPRVLASVREALTRGEGARAEVLNRTKDGRDLWFDIDLRPMCDADGHTTGFVSVASDITARVEQHSQLQALLAALPAGVVVQSTGGQVIEANAAAERLLGLSLAELKATSAATGGVSARVIRDDGSPYPRDQLPGLRTLASGRALTNESLGVRTPAGDLRWLLINTVLRRDSHGRVNGVISCMNDITERRALQERLSDSARTDALTKLPNRAVVMERLQRAIEHARRHPGYGFAVLFMDFDRFKQVNDTLGHGAGDELLRQIAQRLVRTLRPGDALARLGPLGESHDGQVAARLGGDEFVVVLEGVTDAATAGLIADRLLHELAEPYTIGCHPVHSSASVGVVLCAGLDDTGRPEGVAATAAEDVLRNADTAMYEAKRAGRGRWVLFDDSMHERVVRSLAMEQDLRHALQADELFVVYQPVVDLPTGATLGVEALVRWRHPERGLVNPADFIGVAEECGLIDAIGALVLRQACVQFVQWQLTLGEAAPRLVAVNLSRAQLDRAGLVDEVRAVLESCAMAPGSLQLEVTESLAAQDERVQATLRDLKSLGVRLALDDFGTGYSSLACLHQMPVDTVKVDRSFVRHAETVEYHRVLIEATIRVARTLGMTTVAEGIETEGQARLMRELDCDRGQGFLFSRPLPPAELEAWAKARLAAAEAAA